MARQKPNAETKPGAEALLNMTVRALLERLLTDRTSADSDPWVNIRGTEWPWRRIVAAAERGEVRLSRVGRRLLMRRSELDRFIEMHRIEPIPEQNQVPKRASRVTPNAFLRLTATPE